MTDDPFFTREERFATVASTNDVVRSWLAAGVPEVCLAVTDTQTAGRGRGGRTWLDRAGASLLLSLGFRPTWLDARYAWQLPAVTSLAMADAAEEVAGLPDGAIRLKWPNDLVVEELEPDMREGAVVMRHGAVRKLGGVLGESSGLGSAEPSVVVGLGINVDWRPDDFPAEVAPTMTSLRAAAGGRPVDRAILLDAFLARVEPRVLALREGHFAVADWTSRQLTTRRVVDVTWPDSTVEQLRALGVDADTGGLVVEDAAAPRGERVLLTGEVTRVRVPAGAGATTGDPMPSAGRV